MAQGDYKHFDQSLVDVYEKLHDFELDSFKIGLITAAVTPLETTSDPRWGAGGGTNFKTNEVTPGGNYAADGKALANPAVTLAGGLAEIDWDDPGVWATNASNPTDATWGIVYNDTDAGKRCIGFVDLGGAFDMTTGPLTVTFGTPAATHNQA